ncbi:unnamed protein product [Oikopleura dioica]|uniref:Uncharacterized protein n=1 Tax=Oikopleura dioica TaxID=34765 RepID=E4Y7D7_OIKDI|nr:unnamed protein product [Oikopleura dioica]
MMDDDESDEMEQDLEIDEFFDKIKFFKAKSATKIRKLKELLSQKDELIFNLRSELTKAQDALKTQINTDNELEELDIISPSKKKRPKQQSSSSEEELRPKKRVQPRKKGRKIEYYEKAGNSSTSSGHQMLPSKLLNLKPKEKYLPVPKKALSEEKKISFEKKSQISSRSRQSSNPNNSNARSSKSHDISQHFIKKSSKKEKITPEKTNSPKLNSFSPLEDVQLIDSSEDEDETQISMFRNTSDLNTQSLVSQVPNLARRGINSRMECWLTKAQENTKKRKYASFSPKPVSSSRKTDQENHYSPDHLTWHVKLYCIKHCRQLSQSYKVAGACEYEISGMMLSPTARKTLVSNSSTGLKTLKVEIQSAQKLRERRKSEIMGGSRRGSVANRDVLNPQI